jgi:hypothetical protein
LRTELRRAELDRHLEAAMDAGRALGLGADALSARLHEIAERKNEDER